MTILEGEISLEKHGTSWLEGDGFALAVRQWNLRL
jgi:hypothetical protein